MNKLKKILFSTSASITAVLLSSSMVLAGPPGAQLYHVYDNTNDGLDVSVDPVIGNVQVVANPGGQGKVNFQTHLQGAAPDCEYTVELVTGTQADNGGLDAFGHTGFITVLGTLTTNGQGNGNAHFNWEIPSFDGDADTPVYSHLDFEAIGACMEADDTNVTSNEYGAAPDPLLSTPFTWMM